MKQGSLFIPLFTLLLISIPASTFRSGRSRIHDTRTNISRVTAADITQICSQTTNPTYCNNIISHLIGEPLFPDNVRILISRAQNYASSAADRFKRLHSGVKRDKSRQDIMRRYRSCWEGYSYASDQFKQAKRFLRDESSRNVKIHISNAMRGAVSCTGDDMNTNKLSNMGDIVLSICNNFWPQRG